MLLSTFTPRKDCRGLSRIPGPSEPQLPPAAHQGAVASPPTPSLHPGQPPWA